MKNILYRTRLAAIAAGLLISFTGYAQGTVQPAAPKASTLPAAPALPTAEIEQLKVKQKELQKQQRELQQQLREVNQKLSENTRSYVRSYTNGTLFKMDSLHLTAKTFGKGQKMDSLFSSKSKALQGLTIAGVGGRTNFDRLTGMGNMSFNFDNKFSNGFSDPNYKGIEKGKTVSKSYPVSGNDKIALNNQYGKVTINTWNKNEIKVDIDIKAYDSSDEKAQELLESVKIEDSKSNNVVSFKTVISRGNGNSWVRRINGVEERKGVQVNYVVYMPAKSSLDVTNSYGAVVLPDMNGVIKARVSYGSLTTGKLNNAANEIKTSYSNTSIESMQSGSCSVQYGKADIARADNVNLDLSYANGSRIGYLVNGGELNLKYSSGFKIEQLGDRFKGMNVNSTYSPGLSIKAGSSNFDFDVSVNYANFDYNDKVSIQSKEPAATTRTWSSSKNYKGQYGKGSDSKVVIRSSYGSVSFL